VIRVDWFVETSRRGGVEKSVGLKLRRRGERATISRKNLIEEQNSQKQRQGSRLAKQKREAINSRDAGLKYCSGWYVGSGTKGQ
jgi:hypothetical protein